MNGQKNIAIVFLLLFSLRCDAAEVYPKGADKLKLIELGQAVLMLMPRAGSNFYSWSSGSDIAWITDSIDSYPDGDSFRQGLMRINVLGVKSTILKKVPREVAWSVVYRGTKNPNFGVQSVVLEPGVEDGIGNCFGAAASGCTFNPLMSLAYSKITVNVLCVSHRIDGYAVGASLSAEGKKTVEALWATTGGSGGASTSMTLYVNGNMGDPCKSFHDFNE